MTRIWISAAGLIAALGGIIAQGAHAQVTFPTQAAGLRVGGQVMMLCDAGGTNCRPVSSANPLPTSGGAVTIADGADTAEGARADSAYSDTTGSAAGTLIALNKGQFVRLYGIGQTQAQQLTAEQAIQANQTNGSQIAIARGAVTSLGTGAALQLPLLTAGQAQGFTFGRYGGVLAALTTQDGYQISGGYATDGVPNTSILQLATMTFPSVWDPIGSLWQRARGNQNGTFTVGKGGDNLATGQVSVGTTATQIVGLRAYRSRLMITQNGAGPCYYGSTAAVSATTGARLKVDGATKTYNYNGTLYGICPGGAVTVDFDEEY